MLLIEFDTAIPFVLTDPLHPTLFLSGQDPSILSVFSKLTMLTLSFPGLQLLWSTSPEHTASLFAELAKGGIGPDLQRLAKIGGAAEEGDEGEDEDLGIEFLKRFKGINSVIHQVVNKCRNIREVCSMGESEWE